VNLAGVIEVVVGAGIGGGLRYVLGGWMAERWGASFPWHTLIVNASGALFLGMLMAMSIDRQLLSPSARLFLGVGVLGGFTTFSTLSYESVAMLQQGLIAQGVLNMFGSAVLGIAAATVGLLIGRAI
jgi:CrcB protein